MPQRARQDQAPHLADLDEVCFAPGERWNQTLWAEELTGADRLVVLHRDRVHGEDQTVAAAAFRHGAEVVDLHRVMVRPSHRGLGLARQLVAAGASWAADRGAERMLLEVRHDNEAALSLYEGLGFTTLDTRRDYYRAGLDAVVMQVDLPLRARPAPDEGASHD